MDASVEAKANALNEELRKTVQDIDECSKEIGPIMRTHVQKIKDWGETVLGVGKKHTSMSESFLAALLGM